MSKNDDDIPGCPICTYQITCPVHYNPMPDEMTPEMRNCIDKHIFCLSCYYRWYKVSLNNNKTPTCPQCRIKWNNDNPNFYCISNKYKTDSIKCSESGHEDNPHTFTNLEEYADHFHEYHQSDIEKEMDELGKKSRQDELEWFNQQDREVAMRAQQDEELAFQFDENPRLATDMQNEAMSLMTSDPIRAQEILNQLQRVRMLSSFRETREREALLFRIRNNRQQQLKQFRNEIETIRHLQNRDFIRNMNHQANRRKNSKKVKEILRTNGITSGHPNYVEEKKKVQRELEKQKVEKKFEAKGLQKLPLTDEEKEEFQKVKEEYEKTKVEKNKKQVAIKQQLVKNAQEIFSKFNIDSGNLSQLINEQISLLPKFNIEYETLLLEIGDIVMGLLFQSHKKMLANHAKNIAKTNNSILLCKFNGVIDSVVRDIITESGNYTNIFEREQIYFYLLERSLCMIFNAK